MKILVVDDHRDTVEALCHYLQISGCEAIAVTNGGEVFAAAQHHRPDAIVLDLVLGGGHSGFEVLAQLKHDVETRMVPVVCVTGLQSAMERARLLGSAAYLLKPVRPSDLLTTLREAIRANPSARPEVAAV